MLAPHLPVEPLLLQPVAVQLHLAAVQLHLAAVQLLLLHFAVQIIRWALVRRQYIKLMPRFLSMRMCQELDIQVPMSRSQIGLLSVFDMCGITSQKFQNNAGQLATPKSLL